MRHLTSIVFAALTLILASAIDAQAQWVYSKEDNPFSKDTHIAVTTNAAGHGLGFRCTTASDIALIWITGETADSESQAMLKLVDWRLLVIVDDDGKQGFDAVLDVADPLRKFRFQAQGDLLSDLVRKVAGAKRRVAVASETGGKVVSNTNFTTAGSRLALAKLMAGCKIGGQSS